MARTAALVLATLFLVMAETAWAQKATAPPASTEAAAGKPKPAAPPAKAEGQPRKPPGPKVSEATKHTMEMRADLDKLRVTLTVQKTRLADAVRSLAASLSKVNLVLDDTLPISVKEREKTLSLRDVPLRAALTDLAQPDLAFEVVYEAVFLSTH